MTNEHALPIAVLIILWLFFIVMAEWKKDFIYYIMSCIFGLAFGVYLLGFNNISFLWGTGAILLSIYFVIYAVSVAYVKFSSR